MYNKKISTTVYLQIPLVLLSTLVYLSQKTKNVYASAQLQN